MADEALAHLRDTYFYMTVVQSCPTACEFSRISGTERLQFLTVVNTILRRLTPVFEVNKRWYSCHVNPSISPRFMGMGSLRTWRGHPDGRADFAPVSIIRGSTTAILSQNFQRAGKLCVRPRRSSTTETWTSWLRRLLCPLSLARQDTVTRIPSYPLWGCPSLKASWWLQCTTATWTYY